MRKWKTALTIAKRRAKFTTVSVNFSKLFDTLSTVIAFSDRLCLTTAKHI